MRNVRRVFINTLHAGDQFFFNGEETPMTVVSRRSEPGRTRVTYQINGTSEVWEINKPGMSTVELIEE